MAALTDREVAYAAARIGSGVYIILYSAPMFVMAFGGHLAHKSLGLGMVWSFSGTAATVVYAVYYLILLLAGLGLLLGLKTRWAAVIGVLTSLPVASVLYALMFVGLIVFRRYNRLCLDKVALDTSA